MANQIVIHKARTNVITVSLGIDVTGETLTSEIRTQPEVDSPLVATFVVAVIDDETGELTLTLDNTVTEGIVVDFGYMDIKRISGGEPLPVFDRPLEVKFRGVVTE
jgi:hypothetical protein